MKTHGSNRNVIPKQSENNVQQLIFFGVVVTSEGYASIVLLYLPHPAAPSLQLTQGFGELHQVLGIVHHIDKPIQTRSNMTSYYSKYFQSGISIQTWEIGFHRSCFLDQNFPGCH